MFPNACQHHDRAESGSAWDDRTCRHLANEIRSDRWRKRVARSKCTNVKSATRFDPDLPMLGQVLHNAGYATAHFGKWHLGREPRLSLALIVIFRIGGADLKELICAWGYSNPQFKEGQPGEHIEDRMASEAVAWLKQRDHTKPFFLNYWQFSVHAPFGEARARALP